MSTPLHTESEAAQKCRQDRAARSLEGLSVGDALGERFFGPPDAVRQRIALRQLPARRPWTYTDDTEMALSVYAMLRTQGRIEQDTLARAFAERLQRDRGYGRGAFEILWGIRRGEHWLALSHEAFGGKGSYGNGAAMRVAPLGAYFADDLERCVHEARLQSEVTHAHPEGIAGGIAVALAAALACAEEQLSAPDYLQALLERVPASATRDGIAEALALGFETSPARAAETLGNGAKISAQDTVPFCLWMAARRRGNYEEAFWETVAALGDRDTTCAIVGGIIGTQAPVPAEWLEAREGLPLAVFGEEA